MGRALLLAMGMVLPALAWSDPGDETSVEADEAAAPRIDLARAIPNSSARQALLIGSNCSYTTEMMASRVLADGRSWSFAGMMTASENALKSRVAAPFSVGPDDGVKVVANEVLEELLAAGGQDERVFLEGKLLEVEGVSYFVVIGYELL